MMNQETYVKPEDLPKQGWTIKEIATETGYHPALETERGSIRRREGTPEPAQCPGRFAPAYWRACGGSGGPGGWCRMCWCWR